MGISRDMKNTPRVAFGATPLKGGRHLRPGKAGSSVSLDGRYALRDGLLSGVVRNPGRVA